jgi:hypothetical protein
VPGQDVFFCDLTAAQRKTAEAEFSRRSGAAAATFHDSNLVATKRNLEWKLEPEGIDESGEGDPLDDLTEDLLAFALHVYQADRDVKRPASDFSKDWWSRRIELHVGVRDEQLWNDQRIDLARILSDSTRDTFRLYFYHRDEDRPPLRLPASVPPVDGGICIFSTRFNSVFGFASQLAQGSLIASVRYGPDSPKSTQLDLIREIQRLTGGFSSIGFRLTPIERPSAERTQRTLGFLQFALAAGLARRLGIGRIQLFDDAISSYHLQPDQICGPGKAVRDTRPDILRQTLNVFERLKITIKEQLQVHNPFQFLTAGQVLQLPDKLTLNQRKDLLARTDNCLEKDLARALRANWDDAVPHCGCCFPCKMRRLAALVAGLETKTKFGAYAINPLRPRAVGGLNLSENHAKRFEDYHNKGVPAFKSYLRQFKGTSVSNPITWRTITELSSEKLFLGGTPPGVTTATITAVDIQRWITDAHQRFSKEVRPFFPH